MPPGKVYVSYHAQTNTLLIFVAIACNFHEAPLLPFFLYRSSPKFPRPAALSNLVYLVCDYRLDTYPLGWFPGRWTHSIR